MKLKIYLKYCSGNITLDGIDLKKLDPSWLRGRAIGYISQEPVLFATSILENIRYGRPSATDAEVLNSIHNSAFRDTIWWLEMGEGGIRHSLQLHSNEVNFPSKLGF